MRTRTYAFDITTAIRDGWRMYVLELFNAGYSYAGIIGVFYIWKPPIPQYFANFLP
ncbi:hypothetical protein [Treponema putidum]|uniref:hypothetical protein n=1 Tax=Treponema putidum TaxID=221027 RepID=UPI002105EC5D|nr:hypothetical protein [Treponema putidum]